MFESVIMEVSQINEYVRGILSNDMLLRKVRLRGEITNFAPRGRGHWYFSLKDSRSIIDAVMYQSDTLRMSFIPQNGMKVVVSGAITLWAEGGRYQIRVTAMRPEGEGNLYQRFLETKDALEREGLFSKPKKKLPAIPRKIALITSIHGAVLHDVCRISRMRNPSVQLMIVDVPVQGATAAPHIASAIQRTQQRQDVDLIIVGRGGGSIEDLWAFNEEVVVRAIADCRLPVISAVGHETDTTLTDYAADVRASTPSNAAELAVPVQADLIDGLQAIADRLTRLTSEKMYVFHSIVDKAKIRLEQNNPNHKLERINVLLNIRKKQLDSIVLDQLQRKKDTLLTVSNRLDGLVNQDLETRRNAVVLFKARLELLNPEHVLSRGYALVTGSEKQLIMERKDALNEQELHIRFRDGSINVRRMEEE